MIILAQPKVCPIDKGLIFHVLLASKLLVFHVGQLKLQSEQAKPKSENESRHTALQFII